METDRERNQRRELRRLNRQVNYLLHGSGLRGHPKESVERAAEELRVQNRELVRHVEELRRKHDQLRQRAYTAEQRATELAQRLVDDRRDPPEGAVRFLVFEQDSRGEWWTQAAGDGCDPRVGFLGGEDRDVVLGKARRVLDKFVRATKGRNHA